MDEKDKKDPESSPKTPPAPAEPPKPKKGRKLVKPFYLHLGPFGKISAQEKIDFTRHLSVTIKTGIPLLEGLRLIRDQSRSKRFRSIIDEIITDVNNGLTLTRSMEKYKRVFGDFFISIVSVGEASGNLSTSLLYISNELKKQREINSKIKSAMIYPSVVFFATVGMTVFLTTYIFPKILPIFSSLRVELPFTTKIVIKLFVFMTGYYLYIIAGIIVLLVLIKVLFSIKSVRFFIDRFLLRLPVVSRLVVSLTMANFSRSLGILLKSGMTIVDALHIAKSTFTNLYYQKQIENIEEVVRRGEEISRYMSEHGRYFPAMLTGMIKVGESTGTLEENLVYLADYYTEELDLSVKNLTSLLEPLLVLLMGLVVGFIALSIITPIYSVTQGLKIN